LDGLVSWGNVDLIKSIFQYFDHEDIDKLQKLSCKYGNGELMEYLNAKGYGFHRSHICTLFKYGHKELIDKWCDNKNIKENAEYYSADAARSNLLSYLYNKNSLYIDSLTFYYAAKSGRKENLDLLFNIAGREAYILR
ncbi:Hypothetical protein ORPV_104, partial [Orpheovirus IHUMI-LCC2]